MMAAGDNDPTFGSAKSEWILVAEVAKATKDIQDIKRAIHGNGRDGLLADVARLNLKMNIVCVVGVIVLGAIVKLLL